ncbi:MAG: hypothetical protein FWG58_03610 [Methanomassiliicoccaceae archaeon]|nr:hypothetical protein [Methanomassiliicoccaceae archaeon]
MRTYALPCAVLLAAAAIVVLISPQVSAASVSVYSDSVDITFADLLGGWGSAMFDPSTYIGPLQVKGFFHFLMNETFLSSFSSGAYGSLSRSSVLGTIPNIFFAVCLISVMLSSAVCVIELREYERSKRIVRK